MFRLFSMIGFLIGSVVFLQSQTAFPGASGGGAEAIGGRGGIVVEVTNLNDSGPGSLREALLRVEPRTVVFKVGGTIELQTPIIINNSFLTIAGQTAPGDGILIKCGNNLEFSPLTLEDCHDVIIRFIRIRPVAFASPPKQASGIRIRSNCHDIIIDHCSFSWVTGQSNVIWNGNISSYNITYSWNIFAEALWNHSSGLLTGSNINPEGMSNISIHHNLFANNNNRNPLLKTKTGDVVNNIIYGWEWWATGIGGGVTVDIVANKYVWRPVPKTYRRDILWKPRAPGNPATGVVGNPSIYFTGNLGSNQSLSNPNSWESMLEMTHVDHWGWPDDNGSPSVANVPISYRRFSPRNLTYPISINSAYLLDDILLNQFGVGACIKLDHMGNTIPNRDIVDLRVIQEYVAKQGRIPHTVAEVGGYPAMSNGISYTDSDHDGMSDDWEVSKGLDSSNPDDRNYFDLSTSGYTNLEVFLNESLKNPSTFCVVDFSSCTENMACYYGACVNDNKDDSEQLQYAIDLLDELVLENGQYDLSQTLNISNKSVFTLNGQNATLKLFDIDSDKEILSISNSDQVSITKVRFTNSSKSGLEVSSSTNVSIEDNQFDHCSIGIDMKGGGFGTAMLSLNKMNNIGLNCLKVTNMNYVLINDEFYENIISNCSIYLENSNVNSFYNVHYKK